MNCVRCGCDTARLMAEAPDGSHAWEIWQCSQCNFAWRTSEEPETIDPTLRDTYFQLNEEALHAMTPFIPVPPMRAAEPEEKEHEQQ